MGLGWVWVGFDFWVGLVFCGLFVGWVGRLLWVFGFVFWLNAFGVGVVGCFVLFCGLCCFVGVFGGFGFVVVWFWVV